MAEVVPYRGGLALMGDAVEAVAQRWLPAVPDAARAARVARDGPRHHVTLVSSKASAAAAAAAAVAAAAAAPNSPGPLVCLGLGSVAAGAHRAWYAVVLCPALPARLLHVTLGFVGADVHGPEKGVETLCARPSPEEAAAGLAALVAAAGKATPAALSAAGSLLADAADAVSPLVLWRAARWAEVAPSFVAVAAQALAQRGFWAGRALLARLHAPTPAATAGDVLCHVPGCPPAARARLEAEALAALNADAAALTDGNKHVRVWVAEAATAGAEEDAPASSLVALQLPRNFGWVPGTRLAGSALPSDRDHVRALVALGVSDIVTLRETPLPAELAAGLPLTLHAFAVTDRTPPSVEQMDAIVALVRQARGAVLVHCLGGVGRTATALAALLLCTDPQRSPADSVAALVAAGRRVLLDASQRAFLQEWGVRCRASGPGPAEPEPPSREQSREQSQRRMPLPPLLLLVGYPGAGKSTFAEALVAGRGRAAVVRVNRDEMRGKGEVDAAAAAARRAGACVMVDNCNLTRAARAPWLSYGVAPVWAVFFARDAGECRERAVRRVGHPTLPTPAAALRAIGSLEGTLEPPTAAEGFARVDVVESDAAAAALLDLFGGVAPQPQPEEQQQEQERAQAGSGPPPLLKFPRTPHVVDAGGATRDDKVLPPTELAALIGPTAPPVFVEEKVDGANLGVSIGPDGRFLVQNRSHYVTPEYHAQFRPLGAWLAAHSADLWTVLEPGRHVLFGEWLRATHAVPYARLPDWFLAFDLFDRTTGTYMSRPELEARLAGTRLRLVPLIAHKPLRTLSEALALAKGPSAFSDGPREGVVFRRCDGGVVTARAKLVRSDFIAGNARWNAGPLCVNALAPGAG